MAIYLARPHNQKLCIFLVPSSFWVHLQAIMQAAQLKADGKAQRVIVTGCLAQRYSEDLAGDTPLHGHTCMEA